MQESNSDFFFQSQLSQHRSLSRPFPLTCGLACHLQSAHAFEDRLLDSVLTRDLFVYYSTKNGLVKPYGFTYFFVTCLTSG